MTNKLFITNAFSINMLSDYTSLTFIPLNKEQVKAEFINNLAFNIIPAIGHADTASVVKNDLNIGIELFNRISIKPDFKKPLDNTLLGDMLIVAQYTGNRLPEGCTQLPEGSTITYWLVRGK